MRRIISSLLAILLCATTFAQTVTLTFTGKDALNHYVQLNRVIITNLTKGWQETIYWPDTTLTMQNGTGIDESVANGGFGLSQNNPNPFTGTTDVNLTVADAGAVTLEIVDGNGRIAVETTHALSLQPGTHQFRVSLSAAGTYVMTARQNGKTSSVKMVCNGGGTTNGVDYLGMMQTITYVLKSTTTNPFNFGDQMEYVGYATINGTEVESQRITQSQGASQTFVLQFDAIQLYAPSVTTASVGDITTTSATCGGNVTSDGGAAVIERGVCWNTTGSPSITDSHTSDGSGLGEFYSTLNELTPYTEYYVRAYATNSVGTAYGEERSLTTLCDLPEINTTQPTDVATTSFTCGGNVIAINCDALTARGVCWNMTGNPTITDSHTTDGTTAGNFTSSVTDLECNTTYNIRAYATNSVGTVYGEEYMVATLEPTTPDVVTLSATLYNGLNMIVASEVTSENCEAISSRGICYSTSHNPTISNLHTTHSIGLGTLSDTITELNTGTTYYVRAYATNNMGTAYGEELSVTTPTLPTVTTTSVTNITATTATSGGNVTLGGGATVLTRGVCWSTSHNPTVNNSHTTDGSGTGIFTSSLTNLTPSTTYYVRAYATNSVGTAYGSEVSFTTQAPFVCGTSTLNDINGNTYNTVLIGTQCWMKENLRTNKYADGTSISQGSTDDPSITTAYWYYPNNSSSTISTYGRLYNWKAVMRDDVSTSANPSGVQGICPTGWHVPNDAEWTQLTDYVSSQSQYVCGSDNRNIAKALASTTGWESSTTTCAVGNTAVDNNATGFSALPAGQWGVDTYFGWGAYFWSATEYSSGFAHNYYLYLNRAEVSHSGDNKNVGFSVRCVHDDTLFTVTTRSITSITTTTATCGGNVTLGGEATVLTRGVCWSTSHNPTVNNSHTTDGSGTGIFTSNLTNLTPNTTYYARAYATNSVGTVYGEEVNFTTSLYDDGQPCPGTPTLTDRDGNTYNTVLIGNQCWMKENMRTTKDANGSDIAQGPANPSTSLGNSWWYYPNDDPSNKATYGLLYTFYAANGVNAIFVNYQGICPTGWHLPSDAEWTQLTDYVSSQSRYWCNIENDSRFITQALSDTIGWIPWECPPSLDSTFNCCCPGYSLSNNNATGFSARGGKTYNGTIGGGTEFWSATRYEEDDSYIWTRKWGSRSVEVARSHTAKVNSYCFVRCVKN